VQVLKAAKANKLQQRKITDELFNDRDVQVQQAHGIESLADLDAVDTPAGRGLAMAVRESVHKARWSKVINNTAVRFPSVSYMCTCTIICRVEHQTMLRAVICMS
jgi:hypothetical protein